VPVPYRASGSNILLPHIFRNLPELLQHRFQVFNDLCRQHTRFGEIIRVLQTLIPQLEEVQAGFVAGYPIVVSIGAPAPLRGVLGPSGFAVVAVAHPIVEEDVAVVPEFADDGG